MATQVQWSNAIEVKTNYVAFTEEKEIFMPQLPVLLLVKTLKSKFSFLPDSGIFYSMLK